MRFYHYSDSPDINLNNIKFSPETEIKPGGLWLSYDENSYGWKNWCISEDFRVDKLKYKYPVNLDMGKILLIDSQESLDELVEKYYYSREHSKYFGLWDSGFRKLYEDYNGIAFIPYFRLWNAPVWYSAIDCESACVWNKDSISYFGSCIPG